MTESSVSRSNLYNDYNSTNDFKIKVKSRKESFDICSNNSKTSIDTLTDSNVNKTSRLTKLNNNIQNMVVAEQRLGQDRIVSARRKNLLRAESLEPSSETTKPHAHRYINGSRTTTTQNDTYTDVTAYRNDSTTTAFRPVTAISLPTKVQNDENSYDEVSITRLTAGGSQSKNPSCPIMVANNTNSCTKNSKLNLNESELFNTQKKRLQSTTDGSANTQNSKIDTVIGLPTTLFTTKYECIGSNSKIGSDSSIKTIPDGYQIQTHSVSPTNLIINENFQTLLPQTYNQNKPNSKSQNTSLKLKQRPSEHLNGSRNWKSASTTSINAIHLNDDYIYDDTQQQQSNYNYNKDTYYYNYDNGYDIGANTSSKTSSSNNKTKAQSSDHFDKASNSTFLNITENIFISTMACIKNERKMCRLNIEYLIDMTNMRPDDLNRKVLGKLPCLCKTQHSRSYLSIQLNDTSFKTLFNSFIEMNKFIQRARKLNKNVLIFSKDFLEQHLLCACAQYLMLDYEMNLDNALNIITKKLFNSNVISIEKCYLDYLQNFETYLQHLSINLYNTSGKILNRSDSLTNKIFLDSTNGGLSTSSTTEDKSFSNDDDESNDDVSGNGGGGSGGMNGSGSGSASNKTKAKICDKKFSQLPLSEESNLESIRNQSNNLKVAWV